MNKAVLVFLLGFSLVAVARENPFLPAQAYEEVTTPTNVQKAPPLFDQQALSLPSQARVLQYVVFGYQSLDGDTKEVRMEVNKTVDWHDPLVVTKESLLLAPSVKPSIEPIPEALEKPVTPPSQPVVKKVAFKDLIAFEAQGRRIVVTSNDVLLRHFMVANPYKVVLDFKRDVAFYTQTLDIETGAFKSVTMGNHNGHYRAVILLDGHYLYTLKKTESGLEIQLK